MPSPNNPREEHPPPSKAIEEQPPSLPERIQDSRYWGWFSFMAEEFTIIIAFILLYLWRAAVRPRMKNISEILDKKQSMSKEINECLSSLRTIVKSDRAILGQFHNGTYWVSGVPWMSITATHEVTAPGVSPISGDILSIPIERLETELRSLMEKDILVIDYYKAPQGCNRYLYSIGCSRIVESLVYSGKGKPIGIVSLQYNWNTKLPNIGDEQVKELKQTIAVLGSVMVDQSKQGFFKKITSFNKNKSKKLK